MTESSPCATLGVGKGDAASPSERRTACGSNTNMFGSWDDSVGRERSLTGSDVLSSSGHSRQQQACHSVASWRKVHRSRFLSNGNRLPASPSGEALGQGGLISRKSMRYPEGIHSPGRNALGPVSNDVQNLVQLPAVRSEAMQHLRAATDEKSKLPAWRKTISRYILDRMWFNYLVLFLIALNCIFLAMEDPTDHDNKTTLNQVVMVSEYFFASAFTIEMILRILGNGLYAHSFSYLRDPWNVLDCIIVVSALVTIVLEYANIGNGAALNGLRALRLLRPMRAATRVEQAQIIVASLFQSLPQLADVMLLYLFFLLVFGIMSVQLWKGQLSTRCFRPATMEMEPQERICTADLSDSLSYKCPFGYECLEYGNPNYGKTSFDNIGSALLTLFTALTLEGWTDLMYDVSDASSPYASIYFLLIVLAGAFFVVNLALAIINSSFEMNVGIQHEKRAALPSGTVAKGEMQKLAATAKSFSIEAEQFQTTNTQTETPGDTVDSGIARTSKVGTSGVSFGGYLVSRIQNARRSVKAMVQHRRFTYLILTLVFLNAAIMATEHYGQPQALSDFQDYAFLIFSYIFLAEILVKLFALSLSEFVKDRFNVFDTVLVLVSMMEILFVVGSWRVSVFRSFRLLRVFKFAKEFPELWVFVTTIENSVSGTSVLTALLLLVIFIYALLGMKIFGGRFCGLHPMEITHGSFCEGTPRANFDSLGGAVLTVFQIITGEDWNKVMFDGMRGASNVSAVYFVTLIIVGNYLMINLFIAVLFSGLATAEESLELQTAEETDAAVTNMLPPGSPRVRAASLQQAAMGSEVITIPSSRPRIAQILIKFCFCCTDDSVLLPADILLTPRQSLSYNRVTEEQVQEAEHVFRAVGIDRHNVHQQKAKTDASIRALVTMNEVKDEHEGKLLWDHLLAWSYPALGSSHIAMHASIEEHCKSGTSTSNPDAPWYMHESGGKSQDRDPEERRSSARSEVRFAPSQQRIPGRTPTPPEWQHSNMAATAIVMSPAHSESKLTKLGEPPLSQEGDRNPSSTERLSHVPNRATQLHCLETAEEKLDRMCHSVNGCSPPDPSLNPQATISSQPAAGYNFLNDVLFRAIDANTSRQHESPGRGDLNDDDDTQRAVTKEESTFRVTLSNLGAFPALDSTASSLNVTPLATPSTQGIVNISRHPPCLHAEQQVTPIGGLVAAIPRRRAKSLVSTPEGPLLSNSALPPLRDPLRRQRPSQVPIVDTSCHRARSNSAALPPGPPVPPSMTNPSFGRPSTQLQFTGPSHQIDSRSDSPASPGNTKGQEAFDSARAVSLVPSPRAIVGGVQKTYETPDSPARDSPRKSAHCFSSRLASSGGTGSESLLVPRLSPRSALRPPAPSARRSASGPLSITYLQSEPASSRRHRNEPAPTNSSWQRETSSKPDSTTTSGRKRQAQTFGGHPNGDRPDSSVCSSATDSALTVDGQESTPGNTSSIRPAGNCLVSPSNSSLRPPQGRSGSSPSMQTISTAPLRPGIKMSPPISPSATGPARHIKVTSEGGVLFANPLATSPQFISCNHSSLAGSKTSPLSLPAPIPLPIVASLSAGVPRSRFGFGFGAPGADQEALGCERRPADCYCCDAILPSCCPSFRSYLRLIVESDIFEGLILLVVLFSSVTLALENPLAAPDTRLPLILDTIDLVVAILFAAEALLRIVAYGFVAEKTSYLRRDPWNRLDFFIAVCGVVGAILKQLGTRNAATGVIEIVRMMRALRPLRAIGHSPGMRLALQSLFAALPLLSHVCILSTTILTIFGIMGVQLFAGKFYACTDFAWGDRSEYKTITECLSHDSQFLVGQKLRWQGFRSNFDNLGNALLTLFEIMTLEGWVEIMYLGMDSTEHGVAPQENNRPWLSIYFVVFVVVGAFFLVNLFTGVLVDRYERHSRQAQYLTTFQFTSVQQEWKLILEGATTTIRPLPRARLKHLRWVLSDRCDKFIMVCIALNTVVMCLEFAGQSDAWESFLSIANITFIFIFAVEMVLKMIALNPKRYYWDVWNRFDFFVVNLSIVAVLLKLFTSNGPTISLLRILRLARLFRALRVASGLRTLVRTLVLSSKGLVNAAGLLGILFYLYAVVGVRLYGKIQHGEYITSRANFEHFGSAVLLLFRMCTGEGWQGIMHDCQVTHEPACDPQLASCGYKEMSPVFFLTFMILGTFIILNLIIAVILEDFLTAQSEEASIVTPADTLTFAKLWRRYDTADTGLMPVTSLLPFLKGLEPPLGIGVAKHFRVSSGRLATIIEGVFVVDGKVHFKDILLGCCAAAVKEETGHEGEIELPVGEVWKFEKRWRIIFDGTGPSQTGEDAAVHKEASGQTDSSRVSLQKSLAAIKIQAVWRGHTIREIVALHRNTPQRYTIQVDHNPVPLPDEEIQSATSKSSRSPSSPATPLDVLESRDASRRHLAETQNTSPPCVLNLFSTTLPQSRSHMPSRNSDEGLPCAGDSPQSVDLRSNTAAGRYSPLLQRAGSPSCCPEKAIPILAPHPPQVSGSPQLMPSPWSPGLRLPNTDLLKNLSPASPVSVSSPSAAISSPENQQQRLIAFSPPALPAIIGVSGLSPELSSPRWKKRSSIVAPPAADVE